MKIESNLSASQQYYQKIEDIINTVAKNTKHNILSKKHFSISEYPFFKMKNEFYNIVKKALNLKEVDNTSLQFPPSHVVADFSFETFTLAKQIKKNPINIALEIVETANKEKNPVFFEKAISEGAFVNFNVKKIKLYSLVISNILKSGDKYGESDINIGKVAIIDYSSPNIAKPIGVGHLRSTIIGQALANIYKKTGYIVIKDNHLGDWGTQFGKLLFAYKKWGNDKKIQENPVFELKELYVKFHNISKINPEIEDEARSLFAKLENGDPELTMLWKKFRDWSIVDFNKIYKRLGVNFDTYIGESFFVKGAEKVVVDCLEKKICRIDNESGAVVVDCEDKTIPSFLLRKQDGSTLYISRDLAAIKFRFDVFKPNSILYVVGNEQELNFKQLFYLANKIGYLPSSVETKHIGFGMVTVDGKKMSTRRGTIVELQDLLTQSVKKAKEILINKNSDLNKNELNEISEIVGVGAIIYNDLRQTMSKSISFDWNKMFNFEGAGSAAYLQYTIVRIKSILKKIEKMYPGIEYIDENKIIFEARSEFELAKKLMIFPDIIIKAQSNDSPHIISMYLEELASAFNGLYSEISIIKTENDNLRNSRVMLCKAIVIVIQNGLALLNINIPKKM